MFIFYLQSENMWGCKVQNSWSFTPKSNDWAQRLHSIKFYSLHKLPKQLKSCTQQHGHMPARRKRSGCHVFISALVTHVLVMLWLEVLQRLPDWGFRDHQGSLSGVLNKIKDNIISLLHYLNVFWVKRRGAGWNAPLVPSLAPPFFPF